MSSVLFGVKRIGARESAAETSVGFLRSGEVRKTVTVEPDALLSPDSRLSFAGMCLCATRRLSRRRSSTFQKLTGAEHRLSRSISKGHWW